jgi:glycosyltransferase involved in cell wall biosynthesis
MKLSIITINLNNKSGLEKTFKSVFSQTSKDFEYIVIDGVSSDGSQDIILNNKDKITKIIIEKDCGIYHAQNKGILNSTGEYLLFLNSGDNLVNQYLIEKILNEKFDHNILCGDIIYQYLNGFHWTRKIPDSIDKRYFYIDNIPHPSCLIQKKLFELNGLYDETFKITADYNFFLKVFFKGNCTFRHLKYPVSVFQVGGLSSSKINENQHFEERKRAFVENLGVDTYNFYKKRHNLINIFQKKLPYLYNLLVSRLSNKNEISRY